MIHLIFIGVLAVGGFLLGSGSQNITHMTEDELIKLQEDVLDQLDKIYDEK